MPKAAAAEIRGFYVILQLMGEQTVVVWDLETVPDLAAAARMLDLGAAPEAKVREALGSGFPKHPLHKIVCIGLVWSSSFLCVDAMSLWWRETMVCLFGIRERHC